MNLSLLAAHRRLFAIALLSPCVLLGACSKSAAPANAAAPAPVASVQVAPARQGPIQAPVKGYGSVGFSIEDLTTLNVPYAAQVDRLQVTLGQHVRKGQALLQLTPDPTVVANYMQAASAAKAARDELQRTQALYDKQLATQSQLAAARKAMSDADVALAELQRQGASPAPRSLVAAQDGVVTSLAVAQGDRIAAGAALLQLGREGSSRGLRVAMGVDPTEVARVRLGAPVRLAPLASNTSNDAKAAATGHVVSIKQIVNAQSRLVDVSVMVDATGGLSLLPGMQLSADIQTEASTHWIVPRAAVLNDAQGDYLFQVAAGHAHRVPVKKAVDAGDRYGIDGELAASDAIVIGGNYELVDGMAVDTGANAGQPAAGKP